MTAHGSIGPIDVVLLEFPEHTPTGKVAAELLAAADGGAIAPYDIIAVRKRADGAVEGFELSELDDGEVAMSVFAGARSGLLGEDDIADAGSVLAPGSMAVVLVYENTWAAPPHVGGSPCGWRADRKSAHSRTGCRGAARRARSGALMQEEQRGG